MFNNPFLTGFTAAVLPIIVSNHRSNQRFCANPIRSIKLCVFLGTAFSLFTVFQRQRLEQRMYGEDYESTLLAYKELIGQSGQTLEQNQDRIKFYKQVTRIDPI